jgi:DNA mismatch repair protein MutL
MAIRLLSEQLAAKIAAGEVVERPVSVAKELIENSLDAGATRIRVDVKGGGVELIRVVDNGSGMEAEEIPLAFQRHATSKLADVSGLDNIATLGFRGEALPSIASVASVNLTSRKESSPSGWEAALKWGRLERQGPVGCAPGTSVSVAELFENVPARRKFLRSNAAEAGRIRTLISRLILAYPGVSFQLTIDGRDSLNYTGSGRPEDALAAVYGSQVAKEALAVEWQDATGQISVEGFVGPPSLHRSNRRHITFFVNRRWVMSRMLSVALEESYHRLLPQGRYPVAAVNINLPYEDVDVNVHPTKAEVRFRKGSQVFSAVQRAVRGVLVASTPVPEIHIAPTESTPAFQPSFMASPLASRPTASQPSHSAGIHAATVESPTLRVLGQASNTYIVAEGPNGIFLMDQHAAHECVLYEKIVAEMKQGSPSVQALLEPIPVELSPEHQELVKDGAEAMKTYGFELDSFDGHSYVLRAVPAVFRRGDPADGLMEVLEMIRRDASSLGGYREALAASIACHSAVRAGLSLDHREMQEIIRLLERTENPHTCPHGRPTMLHLSSHNLERQFGRR